MRPTPSPQPLATFAHRVALGGALLIGLVLLVWVLGRAVEALLLTFAALLLAIVLRSLSDWLVEHTPLSEAWALAVVITGGLLLCTALIVASAPLIGEQAAQLRRQLPGAVSAFQQWVEQQPWSQWLPEIAPADGENGMLGFGDLLGRATGIAYTAVNAFLGVFIVLFATLYLAINPRLYINGLLHLIPLSHRPRAVEVMNALGRTLRSWLFGTLIRMLAVGGLVFVGLWSLDVPLALILATLAGLLEFVPYFGPIIAAVPAVLVAFGTGPELALYVAFLYFVIQQVESLIISPVVYQQTTYLPPVLTILAQILLFSMAGVLGGVLATPLMAVALVLIRMLYVEQTLGDYGSQGP